MILQAECRRHQNSDEAANSCLARRFRSSLLLCSGSVVISTSSNVSPPWRAFAKVGRFISVVPSLLVTYRMVFAVSSTMRSLSCPVAELVTRMLPINH